MILTTILTAILTAGMTPAVDWNPCQFEDGSGQRRCVWDAKHMGDGQGDSVKIRRGGTDDATYQVITHRRAKHLLGDNH